MMEILTKLLMAIGGTTVIAGIVYIIAKLVDLFERVDRLETNDDIRREDITDIQDQLMRMGEDKNEID